MTLNEELNSQRRKVDFDTYDLSVQQLLGMVSSNQINMAPEYQRHFRWDNARQSQLVESIFLGIPVPPMFMATNADSTWEVVDGVQRLSSLIHFAGDDIARGKIGATERLRIVEVKKLPSLNGLTFDRLPPSVQTQFALRPVKVVTLSDKSDVVVRFDLFERLNTGGVRLSDQEIRACVLRGRFNDFLAEMAAVPSFKIVLRLPPARRDDRTEEECVLRFFAFLHGYRGFKHSVVDFLNDHMKLASSNFDYAVNRDLFTRTFRALAVLFPNGISSRVRQSTPMNLFEGIAVGAALAMKENGHLARQRDLLSWMRGHDLTSFTSGATNTLQMVTGGLNTAPASLDGRARRRKMPFSHIQGLITQRLQEIHELSRLGTGSPVIGSDVRRSIRGHIYVSLYGLYERVVAECVTSALDHASSLSIRHCDLKDGCLLFALHPDLQSYRDLGPYKTWNRGLEFLRKLASEQPAAFEPVFPADGSHMRPSQLELIWVLFELPGEPWPDRRLIGRIEELVEARNSIAHGDESAGQRGGLLSDADMAARIQDTELLCTHILTTFSSHLRVTGSFVRHIPQHRVFPGTH